MAVENKIARIKKRTGALVPFDSERIMSAILGAAKSIGGFAQDIIPKTIYSTFREKSDHEIAELLCDDVLMCLNANNANVNRETPPDVETIQDMVLHVLRSRGFSDTADVYEVYRSGRAKIREGDIDKQRFAGNGFPEQKVEEIKQWNIERHCETVQKLNAWVLSGRFKELVDASIAEYDRQLDEAAQKFLDKGNVKLLMVTGPSSSGKTTTTMKLAQRLAKKGFKFHTLNLDDYFLGLTDYPQDSFGDWDFETPHALRLDMINDHLGKLLQGETISKPKYDFKRGVSIPNYEEMKIEKDEILLIDSLHGLYPPMTSKVPEDVKFKLYIELISYLKIGDGSSGVLTKWTDVRMLRRMLRDRDHRNHSPKMTLGHWHFVRRGELRDMIPYIRTVDYIINGGLSFELPILKKCLGSDFPDPETFLKQGRMDAYLRGVRTRRLLDSLVTPDDISTKLIPGDCHLREFIGGSELKY